MLEIKNLRVQSFDIDHLDLFWSYDPTTEDLGLYDLDILRAESPGGPFQTVATVKDASHFRDVGVNRQHTWRSYYYKIKATNRRDDQTREFGPEWLRARPTLEGLEMSKLFSLLLRTQTGRKCWVFKRRVSGQRCVCYDPIANRRIVDSCETCFDTGFVGGYWSPIETFLQIDPAAKSSVLSSVAETQQQDVASRTSNFPPLDPRDVIVEGENVRWRVAQVTPTERARSLVHQEMRLHRISESDMEYRLPIKLTTPVEPTPADLFTEPLTL